MLLSSRLKRWPLVALAAPLSVAAASPAWAGDSGASDVSSQMESLKTQLAELKAANTQMQQQVSRLTSANDQAWLDEKRAEEVKALVKEVLSDADTRASLADGGMTAGHNGKNFFLASEDGTFLMNISGQLQVRYVANFRDSNSRTATDSEEDGFQIRRAKIGFDGYIGNPKLEYKVLFDTDRNTQGVGTQDLWVAYTVMDGLKVWGGRFQDRFGRESYMSSKYQQTADRTAVAYIWAGNDDFVEGVGAEWKALPDYLMISGTINDGLNSGTDSPFSAAATGFQNNSAHDFNNDGTDVAFSGRVDAKLLGDWKNMTDVESWSSAEDLQVFLGAGVHYEVGESGDRQASSNFKVTSPGLGALTIPYDNFTQWTVDTLIKYEGFSLMAAGYGWYISTPGGPTGNGTIESYAATVQAGYFVIPDKLEPFVRWEWISVDNALHTNDLNLATAGVNYFFKKHAAKVTVDAVWALNNINSANTFGTSLSGAGLLTDDAHREDQVVLRAQFQLLF